MKNVRNPAVPETRKQHREELLHNQGKMSPGMFAEELGCSVDSIKRYLRMGPKLWPDSWHRMGVHAERQLDRGWVIWLDPGHPMSLGGDLTVTEKRKLRRISKLSSELDLYVRAIKSEGVFTDSRFELDT